jgi:hypothetical protein
MPGHLADTAVCKHVNEVYVGIVQSCAQAAGRPVSLPACVSINASLSWNGGSDHVVTKELIHRDAAAVVIALWLGHESVETTQMYIHADMHIKERAMARTRPVTAKPGRYQPDDKLLAFLEGL